MPCYSLRCYVMELYANYFLIRIYDRPDFVYIIQGVIEYKLILDGIPHIYSKYFF